MFYSLLQCDSELQYSTPKWYRKHPFKMMTNQTPRLSKSNSHVCYYKVTLKTVLKNFKFTFLVNWFTTNLSLQLMQIPDFRMSWFLFVVHMSNAIMQMLPCFKWSPWRFGAIGDVETATSDLKNHHEVAEVTDVGTSEVWRHSEPNTCMTEGQWSYGPTYMCISWIWFSKWKLVIFQGK